MHNSKDVKLQLIHDNLNNQWLLADLSDKKYKFYYKIRPKSSYKQAEETNKIKKIVYF